MRPRVRTLIGLDDGAFDRGLRAHRRRFLDRAAIVIAGLGIAFLLVALAGGDVGNLHAGDWIGAGSVFIAAAGLLLSLGGSS
jgi:hypothetical protein